MVQDKWDRHDPCPDGALMPFNIDAKLNGAYIAFGLLFGGGDFEKTMEISTRCGQDSDCNPSSAAGVLGVMQGYRRIPAKFLAEMPTLENKKFAYTDYSFNDIVRSTERRAIRVIEQAGGRATTDEILIPEQKPKAPKLEQWSPGFPSQRLGASDAAFSYTGNWEKDKSEMVSRGAGNEVTLRFVGRAVVILGNLAQDGGQAEVYLDGKKVGGADAFIVERTHDNVLWSVYGLKTREHVVRLVTTGKSDARSKGDRVTIQGAVTYR
jgi:hypothetical protein